MENLNSIEEWLDYISQIPMLEMITHAKYLGSFDFYDEMEDLGYESNEIMDVYNSLALRFLQLEMRVPDLMDGAKVSFRNIASGVVVPK
jgi:hypothetical protein